MSRLAYLLADRVTHSDERQAAVLETHGLDNALDAVHAFETVGGRARAGFDLAACCALLVNESNGRNLWGGDPWNRDEYPRGIALNPSLNESEVSQGVYTVYKLRRNSGLQPQGCGPCQLTDASLQIEAEKLGGCWIPVHSMTVGFRFLQQLFVEHGSAYAGFEAYNGSGPAAEAYAQRACGQQAEWRDWLAA
jgi:hypothetical protein